MTADFDVIVIGAGQAGLVTSYCLKQQQLNHIVLEAADQPVPRWRAQVWDSFTWVTPNWTLQIPGMAYDGDQPDGFLTKQEIIDLFDAYATRYALPVRCSTRVETVEHSGTGFIVRTPDADLATHNVVIATGAFQTPRIPSVADRFPESIRQLHSSTYRNPQTLPEGAVLVVGSAQSGMQIAEELYQSGRKVYLSVSRVGRLPRRYRGSDVMQWADRGGVFDETVDQLQSLAERFAPNPHLSGRDGGHTLSLHQFARDGVSLLGRVTDVGDGVLYLGDDLRANLAFADSVERELVKNVDAGIERMGLPIPPEPLPDLRDGYEQPEIRQLNLEAANVRSVVWATGYSFDFSLVRLPVTDEYGYPVTRQGVTDFPGLYFVGLPYLHRFKSGLVYGVGADADHIARHIAARVASP